MIQTKTLAIKKEKAISLAQFGILLGIALIAPFIREQAITGSMVNAVLFVSTAVLGIQAGILIGLIPSVVSLFVGLLSPALVPMIPFIVAGNAVLVAVFGLLRERNFWLGMAVASVLKFLFLFGASSIIINLFLKKEIAAKVAVMMSWPQLFTALSGGLIAYIVLKIIKKA